MTPRPYVSFSFVRRLVNHAGVARSNSAMSAALQTLVLGVALIHPETKNAVHTHCNTGSTDGFRGLRLLEEGITLAPESRVSVRRTPNGMFVHVAKGEVLFKRRETHDYPIVVTAGNARISQIEAVVCVGVERERTVIAVLDGVTQMWALEPDGVRYAMNEMTLRGGDRVELRQVGGEVVLRFETVGLGGFGSCARSVTGMAGFGDSAKFGSR